MSSNSRACAFANVSGQHNFCGCHGFMKISPERMELHWRELGRRMWWCIKHGHVPANENLHLAERWFSDDGSAQLNNANFAYGVPPWHSDGTPNPAGIPFTEEDAHLRALVHSPGHGTDAENQWKCTSCGAVVPRRPRPWIPSAAAQVEPHDWWWCTGCRQNKPKPSQQQLRRCATAATCHKIQDLWCSKKVYDARCDSPA